MFIACVGGPVDDTHLRVYIWHQQRGLIALPSTRGRIVHIRRPAHPFGSALRSNKKAGRGAIATNLAHS